MKEQNFKNTEVGLIPEDWELCSFGDVSFMKGRIGWQGLKQTEFTDNANEPFLITGMNFKNGKINWKEVYHVSFERYSIAKEIQLQQNDVLMTKDGTIGKLLYVEDIPSPGFATLNSHLLLFRPKNKSYHPKYLYFNLGFKYFLKHIEENKSGTTFFGISQESVSKYQIPLPPLPEQKKIAEALSDCDSWIENIEQLIAKKRQLKQGAMQQLLTPKENWEVKTVFEIVNESKSLFNDGDWIEAIHLKENGIRLLQTGNIGVGKFFEKNNKKYISEESFTKLKCKEVFENDILICRLAEPAGRCCVLPKIQEDKAIVSVDVSIYRPNENEFNRKFLVYMMTKNEWFNKVLESVGGTTHKRISRGNLGNIQIPFPNLQTQTEIATILSDMDAEIETLEQKLQKAQNIKLGMMQDLLTGKVRLVETAKTIEIKEKKHNEYIEDAVIIGTLASVYASEKFLLTRFKYTKVSYLIKRFKEENTSQFLKKPAGPYNPKTRYGGAEKIAINNKYVRPMKSSFNGKEYNGFIAGENVEEAVNYFKEWKGEAVLDWIVKFKYETNDNLELWTTVDMAIEDLRIENKPATVESIKGVIAGNKDWKEKLNRPLFSDINIANAMVKLENIWQS